MKKLHTAFLQIIPSHISINSAWEFQFIYIHINPYFLFHKQWPFLLKDISWCVSVVFMIVSLIISGVECLFIYARIYVCVCFKKHLWKFVAFLIKGSIYFGRGREKMRSWICRFTPQMVTMISTVPEKKPGISFRCPTWVAEAHSGHLPLSVSGHWQWPVSEVKHRWHDLVPTWQAAG